MSAFRTGAHVLNLVTVIAKPHKFRATCSCGSFKYEPVTGDYARILHGTHVDSVLLDAEDSALDRIAMDAGIRGDK